MSSKRIYLDSNVVISMLKTEVGFNQRGLFVEAQNFFESLRGVDTVLVVSKFMLDEVLAAAHYEPRSVLEFLRTFGLDAEVFDTPKNLFVEKFEKMGIHFADASHIAIAIAAGCDCIVTFNIKDFSKAAGFIKIFQPAEL